MYSKVYLLLLSLLICCGKVVGNDKVKSDNSAILNDILFHIAFYLLIACAIVFIAWLYNSSDHSVSPGSMLDRGRTNLRKSRSFKFLFDEPVKDIVIDDATSAGTNASESQHIYFLIFCFFGLQTSFVSWGYFQERIMTINYGTSKHDTGRFIYSELLVLLNKVGALFMALLITRYRTDPNKSPPYKFSLASISNVMASWFQYEALKYVNFPLQVMCKSAKILWAMMMGKVVSKKTYTWSQYGMASLIALGLSIFKYGQGNKKQSSDSSTTLLLFGIFLLSGYIVCDSFTSTWQGKIFKEHKISPYQMMVGMNVFSSIIVTCSLLLHGALLPGLSFLLFHPLCLLHALLMALCSAVGQLFIFNTLATFGPVVFATIMTIRQLLSVCLSIFSFGHEVSAISWFGIVLVFLSGALKVWEKKKSSDKKYLSKEKKNA